jgi:hypothetical protein
MAKFRTPLTIRLEGPAVKHNRIKLRDFLFFIRQLQNGVERVARVLSGQSVSVQAGRKPTEIQSACSLDIVEIKGGSLTIICDLPLQPQETLYEDLGEEALTHLINGINVFESKQAQLPPGYDKGVFLSWREGGKLFDHGIEKITFDLKTRRGKWTSTFTPDIQTYIISQIQEPMENRRTLEGRLLMGDFKETGFRCRIHPPLGKPILCQFEEALKESVLASLTRFVRVVGEATEINGQIQTLQIEDIEIIDGNEDLESKFEGEYTFFEAETNLESLAESQQVEKIKDFSQLLGDFWPEDESLDQFIEKVREWRYEGEERYIG